MIESSTADTNILIYAADPTDARKHAISTRIVAALTLDRSVLPMQALGEFYSATVRKGLLSAGDASSLVRLYQSTLHIVPAAVDYLVWALAMHQRQPLQFFDLLLCATVRRAGCTVLLSEDMQHGQVLDGLRILNPFLLSPSELDPFIG